MRDVVVKDGRILKYLSAKAVRDGVVMMAIIITLIGNLP